MKLMIPESDRVFRVIFIIIKRNVKRSSALLRIFAFYLFRQLTHALLVPSLQSIIADIFIFSYLSVENINLKQCKLIEISGPRFLQ